MAYKTCRRGMFNLDSQATEDNWGWEDCFNVIEHLSRAYAAQDELSSAELYNEGSCRIDRLPPSVVAKKEGELNSYFSGFGTRSQLYEYLEWEGCRYIDRVCRSVIPLAVLEVETGYPSEPRLIHGLSQFVYPIMLPIVRDRMARGDTGLHQRSVVT